MRTGLGGITFQNSCPYRGRKDLDSTDPPTWICTIKPGKECSADNCTLAEYPFQSTDENSEE